MDAGGLIAIVLFVGIALVAFLVKEHGLADPTNRRFISTTQMRDECQIDTDVTVSACLLRQSGNLYRDLGVLPSPLAALHEIEKSFSRAKIDSVAVMKNTDTEFRVLRLHHSHGGKAEGKKLGGAYIKII